MELIKQIRHNSPNTNVYIISILPTNFTVSNTYKPILPDIIFLNNALKNYCEKNQLIYIDLFPVFLSGDGLNTLFYVGDGIHLNAVGYLEWSKYIKSFVED